jgi:hypothetical protein
VTVAFRLHGFLEEVEVDSQRVSADGAQHSANLFKGERLLVCLPHELRRANVADDERRRGMLAQPVPMAKP